MNPAVLTQVGFRYVDRIRGSDNLDSLQEMLNSELLGVLTPALAPNIELSLSETRCKTEEGNLLVRYGMVPPGVSHDPQMMEPIKEKSWVLDVDSFSTKCNGRDFTAPVIQEELSKVSGRAYAFFRWSVKPKFMEVYKAENHAKLNHF